MELSLKVLINRWLNDLEAIQQADDMTSMSFPEKGLKHGTKGTIDRLIIEMRSVIEVDEGEF